jgi:hypothetical protein
MRLSRAEDRTFGKLMQELQKTRTQKLLCVHANIQQRRQKSAKWWMFRRDDEEYERQVRTVLSERMHGVLHRMRQAD